ncbi:factor of DNA methylation 4-like [Vicia villosa]|uniref:factor of DNA methylation 4-like n=1 Tax=Vicia villosa TaxID=3911 RepID=UPI00273C22B9|nr:factor of DNA methylation 4-like [Vicia villosa]
MMNVDTDRSHSMNAVNDRSLIAKDKSPIVNTDEDELFVWPWMVVLANNVTTFDTNSRKYIGKSNKKIQEELIANGFQPLKVNTLWNINGQTPFVIVEFGKEWDGFSNALKLEGSFEVEHCGKRDYLGLRERGDRLFGWIARSDDYNSTDIVGKHLRENGDLKTVSGKEAEDNRKALKLASNFANTLKQKNKELEQTTSKYEDTKVFLNRMMDQKEEMLEHFNIGMLILKVDCLN